MDTSKIKRMLAHATLEELSEIKAYCKKRRDILWRKNYEQGKENHKKRMQALQIGTEIIVKFGALAGHKGKIEKHGRKRAIVEFEKEIEGSNRWYVYYDKMDIVNKNTIETAKFNVVGNKIFEKVFCK